VFADEEHRCNDADRGDGLLHILVHS
jgi:hypothetical protein